MRQLAGTIVAVFAVCVGAPLHAADANSARALAANCATCHGTDGRSVGGVPPSLAGQNKAIMLQSLKDFRDGNRPATVMHQQAKGYTDAQLDEIAGYFSNVNPAPIAPSRGGY